MIVNQPIAELINIKEFILDHNFNIIFTKKIDWGLGISIINTGKSFQYENPIGSPPKTQNIQFITYIIFILIPVKDIFELELKALYTENLPTGDPNEDHVMYSVSVLYKLNKKVHNR